MKKNILLTLLIVTSGFFIADAQPQDKAQLEKERQEIQKELKEMQGMYDQIKGKSKQALSQLSVLNRKINLRGTVYQQYQ